MTEWPRADPSHRRGARRQGCLGWALPQTLDLH